MQNLTASSITDAVLETMDGTENPRLKEIMTSLITHLHAFVREVELTEEEWLAGIQFLTAVGHKTDERRQEFILFSDTLGVSSLKDLINNQRTEGMTEWSNLGPFYRSGAADLPLGGNIAHDVAGDTLLVSGRVLTPDGRPLANALVDVWQSDAEGFYDLQRMGPDQMNLRGRFRTNADGEYFFRTIRPNFYPVPDDGPVGDMLKAMGRHPYRPAHIHFQVSADGYKFLNTELYPNHDPYLESDVVFGVRSSLVVDLAKHDTPSSNDDLAARANVTPPYLTLHYDFVLERA